VCQWCVTLGLGLLSTEVIVVKKINILFKFLNVNKLAVNKLEVHIPYTVPSATMSSGINSFNVQRVYGHRQNLRRSVQHDMYSTRWSAQHNRHVAFKLCSVSASQIYCLFNKLLVFKC